jgi:uncharacterized protein (DUF2147 family)
MFPRKIRHLWIVLTFLFLRATITHAQTQPGDVILGDWMDSKKETVVHCFKKNGKYYGSLIWIENIKARGQPISKEDEHLLNYLVLKDFEYIDDEWANGIIHQPKTQKTYTAYIKLISNDTMEVVGYKFFRFLSESQLFTRVTAADVVALKLNVIVD